MFRVLDIEVLDDGSGDDETAVNTRLTIGNDKGPLFHVDWTLISKLNFNPYSNRCDIKLTGTVIPFEEAEYVLAEGCECITAEVEFDDDGLADEIAARVAEKLQAASARLAERK
jgi:hypothetical protein